MTAITVNAASQKSCFCCHKPPSFRTLPTPSITTTTTTTTMSSSLTLPRDHNSSMDVDAALNELGMLSSITDGRKQYIRERSRSQSEQGTSFTLGSSSSTLSSPTSSSSPFSRDRIGGLSSTNAAANVYDTDSENNYSPPFQIIAMNPSYVTSFSNTPCLPGSPSSLNISTQGFIKMQTAEITENMNNMRLGADYRHHQRHRSSGEEHHCTRFMRLKMARLRRWRKPYEVPWRASLESGASSGRFCRRHELVGSPSSSPSRTIACSNSSSQMPTKTASSDGENGENGSPGMKRCASNSNTPEKQKQVDTPNNLGVMFHRSRSMDDLDIKKFPIAQAENLNYMQEKREIDSMSQYLKDLKVDAE